MMRRMSTKRNLVLLLLVLAIAMSFVLAACGGGGSNQGGATYVLTLDRTSISLDKGQSTELSYQLTKNGETDTKTKVNVSVNNNCVEYDAATGKLTAKEHGIAVVTLTVDADKKVTAKLNVSVPEYTISIKGAGAKPSEVNLGSEEVVEFGVYRDGIIVKDKKVKVTVTQGLEEGAETVIYKEIGNRLNFIAQGEAAVKVELADDPTVFATKSYRITKSFWSSDKQVNKEVMKIVENSDEDNCVSFPGGGGNQYFLGVMDGGAKYVFSADLRLPIITTTHSVGLAHTLDKNNSSLWFGVQGASTGSGYRIYVKDFYDGWGKPGQDMFPATYDNIIFDSEVVNFMIVRDGQNYWYNIGGYVGTYTSAKIGADAETWAGIYAQEQTLTITNYKYDTDEDAIAEAKAACEVECIKLTVANAGVNKLVKGTTYVYNAAKVCRPGTNPEITWELDKTGMTNGAEGTTLVNGAISLDADAAGTAVVIAKCGDKEVKINVEILQTSLADENDILTVDGGVTINEDGSVEFPEMYNGANATLSATEYGDEYYSAKLKSAVKGDFELSFKITDLKTVAGSGYLVSLGEKYGNFLFSANGVTLVSQFIERTASPELKAAADLSATFEAADEYAVTIAVVNGFYKVTVNGTELVFGGNALRRIEDYTAARNVLITIKAGTSMVVSDIALTDKPDAKYIVLNNNSEYVKNGDDEVIGFESKMIAAAGGSWIGKDKGVSTTYYGELLPEGDYTVSMNVKYNSNMSDSKFGIQIGNWEYHVNNKISASGCIEGELYDGGWHNNKANTNVTSVDEAFNVTLKRVNGTIYFLIDGKLIKSLAGSPDDRVLKFWTLADDGSAANGKVAVTDLNVKAGAVIISVIGPDALQKGTTSVAYSATVIGSTDTPVWTMNDDNLTAGTATWNANNTLTFSSDAAGSVVVTATVGGESASITVAVTDQPADQNTALAESKGGVKQDVATRTLIFDAAEKNGVADEQKYSENSGYYAILNTAANTRATIRDNFVLEFTVSDYVTTAQYPKLMISLGARFEQFYVVYNNSGVRIETFTMGDMRNCNGGKWINSDYKNIDKTVSHVFKIVCEDGYYKVYVDNDEFTNFNENGSAKEMFRSPESMAIDRNVMITTNEGTTATVSNISLTAVAGKEGKVTASYADWYTKNADGSITVNMTHQSEDGRNTYHNAKSIYSIDKVIGDNSVISLDVKFAPGTYNDEAVLIKFGSDRSIGVVSNGNNAKVEVQWAWGGNEQVSSADLVNGVRVQITMTDGFVSKICFFKFDASGNLDTTEYNVSIGGEPIPNIGVMSLSTFIYNTPSNGSATVSNITVTNA